MTLLINHSNAEGKIRRYSCTNPDNKARSNQDRSPHKRMICLKANSTQQSFPNQKVIGND